MLAEIFKINIGFLSKYLNHELTQDQILIYWDLLKHLSDEKFKVACENVVKDFIPTSTVPFPLVAHILRYCGEAGDNQVINAIGTLKKAIKRIGQYESVNFNDPALHYTIHVSGGWSAMCDWSQDDWNINEKRISETYRMAIQTNKEGPRPIGISEQNNGFYRIYSILDNGTKIISNRITPLLAARNMQDDKLLPFFENK